MKRGRKQSTLGSLMILVATVALPLSVSKASWIELGARTPFVVGLILFFFVMFLVGFSIGIVGNELASWVGQFLEVRSLESRKSHFEPRIDPSAGQEM